MKKLLTLLVSIVVVIFMAPAAQAYTFASDYDFFYSNHANDSLDGDIWLQGGTYQYIFTDWFRTRTAAQARVNDAFNYWQSQEKTPNFTTWNPYTSVFPVGNPVSMSDACGNDARAFWQVYGDRSLVEAYDFGAASPLGLSAACQFDSDNKFDFFVLALNTNSHVSWYTGTGIPTDTAQMDMLSIATHESEHALGFGVDGVIKNTSTGSTLNAMHWDEISRPIGDLACPLTGDAAGYYTLCEAYQHQNSNYQTTWRAATADEITEFRQAYNHV